MAWLHAREGLSSRGLMNDVKPDRNRMPAVPDRACPSRLLARMLVQSFHPFRDIAAPELHCRAV